MTYRANIIKTGTAASRPLPTGSAGVYLCTDIPAMYYDGYVSNANTWQQFTTEFLTSTSLVPTNYTTNGWFTLESYGNAMRAGMNGNATFAACALVSGSLSSSAMWIVTLIANVTPSQATANGVEIGVAVTTGTTASSSTGHAIYLYVGEGNTVLAGLESSTFTLGSTRSSTLYSPGTSPGPFITGTGHVHLRMLADGTNLHHQMSSDGFHWTDFFSEATPGSLTNYGFLMGQVVSGNSPSYGQAIIYVNSLTTNVTSYTISSSTAANPSVVTLSTTHSILPGDTVAIHGSGQANLNSGTGNGTFGGAWVVTAVGTNTVTVSLGSTPGGSASGGTMILLSR